MSSSETEVDFDAMTRDDIIRHYTLKGFTQKEIVSLLLSVHNVQVSVRTVKRTVKELELTKQTSRGTYTRAVQFAQQHLQGSAQCLGYRAFWKRLQQNDIHISQKKTLELLRLLDGKGVAERKRGAIRRRNYVNPGPNFAWHVDGYDKLKPYGFPIHGAIDGFSRRILWMEVGSTNNNPILIAKYFVNTAITLSYLPCVIRTDRGTENVHIEKIQRHFRSEDDDYLSGDASFQYGKSTGNQRIEAFWGQLRRKCCQFWMNKFKDMATLGSFDMSSKVEMYTLRFCYIHLLRRDLKQTVTEWNEHNIQSKANQESVNGKPDVLFFAPGHYGAAQYGKPFNSGNMHVVLDTLENLQDFDDCPHDYITLLNGMCGRVPVPVTMEEADSSFLRIVDRYRRICATM